MVCSATWRGLECLGSPHGSAEDEEGDVVFPCLVPTMPPHALLYGGKAARKRRRPSSLRGWSCRQERRGVGIGARKVLPCGQDVDFIILLLFFALSGLS